MHRFSTLLDVAIVAVVLLFSASIAYDLLAERRLNTLVGTLPPALMLACGHGLVEPIAASPALQEFQHRQRPSVSCADAVGDGRGSIPTSEVMSTRYAEYAIALAFRIGGISWRTVDAYLAILFGLSMSLAYALFRLVTGRVLSVIGVALLVFSPHALGVALPYRDFSKEFWFLAGWLGIAVLLRRGRPLASPAIYLPAVATGLVLGLGLGFRADMAIMVPAFVAVIVVGLRGMTRATIKVKAIAAGAFVLTYLVAGAPILMTFAAESSVSHVIVLGLVTPFTDGLGLESPPYDFGNLYSDDFAIETVHVHALLVDHDASLGELRTRAYDRQGMSLLRDAAWHFPADFAVRGLGATRQALVNPFDPQTTAETSSMPALAKTPVRRLLLRGRNAAAGWLHGYELLLVAVACFAVAVRDRWLAAVTTLLVLYFPGYSMLQFSRRHTFHLDVVAVGVMLVAFGGAASLIARLWREHRAGKLGTVWAEFIAPAALGALTGVLLWSAGAGVLKVLRVWQQRQVTTLFERTLAAPSSDMAMLTAPLAQPAATGPTHGTWERIAQYRPGLWSTAVLLRPAPGAWPADRADVRLNAEYLIIDVSSSGCTAEPLPIMVKYSIVPGAPYEDLTRAFYLPVGNEWQLLIPIIEIPGGSHFDGLAVPAALLPCVHRVRRVSPPEAVPFPNALAVLGADWRSTALYQRLRDTPVPPGELAIILSGQ
jgi:hypothetical protein